MNTVNGQRSTVNVSNIKIKICGNTNLEDSLLAAELGADYIGFVFYSKSPRYIKQEQAAQIIKQLPKSCQPVGVFVNQSIDEVNKIAADCNLSLIQLSGNESLKFCQQIDLPVIKAFHVKNHPPLNPLPSREGKELDDIKDKDSLPLDGGGLGWGWENPNNVFAYLFDTYVEGLYGGTGQRFDLSLIKDKHFNRPFFISGGLTPQNIAGILDLVDPYAVDVCSGVEATPGKKDPHKLEEFIEIATR